jgi:hypothetical protein
VRVSAWFGFALCVGLLATIADAAQTERLLVLSTKLRPIEEAHKMRNFVLKDFSREVDYITDLQHEGGTGKKPGERIERGRQRC